MNNNSNNMNEIFEQLFANANQMQSNFFNNANLFNQNMDYMHTPEGNKNNFSQIINYLQKNTILNLLTTRTLLDNNLDLIMKNFNEILTILNKNQSNETINMLDYNKIMQNIYNNSLECLQNNNQIINKNIINLSKIDTKL